MAEKASVTDTIKSIVPQPEANLSIRVQEIHSEVFPADGQGD